MSWHHTRHPMIQIAWQHLASHDVHGAMAILTGVAKDTPSLIPTMVTQLTRLSIQQDDPLDLQLGIASLLIMGGYYTDALMELDEALDTHRFETRGYELLGKIWHRNPDVSGLEDILERGLASQNFDPIITDLLARIYLRRMDYNKAIHLFQRLVIHHPHAPHYRATVANLLTKAGRYDEAIQEWMGLTQVAPLHTATVVEQLNGLRKQLPNHLALLTALIQLHATISQPDAVVERAKEWLTWHPDQAVPLLGLLQDALGVFPDSIPIQLVKAHALVATHSYSDAMDTLQQVVANGDASYWPDVMDIAHTVIRLYPAQMMAHQLLCDLSLRQENHTQALSHLASMSHYEHPDCQPMIEQLTIIQAHAPAHATEAEWVKGRLWLHARHYQKAIESASLIKDPAYDTGATLLKASALDALSQHDQADASLLAHLNTHPYDTEAHRYLRTFKWRWVDRQIAEHPPTCYLSIGRLYLMKEAYHLAYDTINQHDDSVESAPLKALCQVLMGHYAQALQLTPHGSPPHPLLDAVRGLCQRHLGMMGCKGDAIAMGGSTYLLGCIMQGGKMIPLLLDEASKGPLTLSHPHNNKGVSYVMNGHYQAAESEFKLALQMDPGFSTAYYNLSVLYLLQHQWEQALSVLTPPLPLQHDPLLSLFKGLCWMGQSQWGDAKSALEKAITLYPQHPVMGINLGDIHQQLGDMEGAMRHWQSVHTIETAPLLKSRCHYLVPLTDYVMQFESSFSFLPLHVV